MKSLSFIAAAAAFAPIVEAEYVAALEVHEDNPRLDGLGDLGNLIAACLAIVLKIQLPDGRTSDVLWNGADEQKQLSWSMAQDALRLAAQSLQADPVIAACEAYHRAREAVNDFEGPDSSPEAEALTKAWDDAAAECYRTVPTTAEGVRAFLEVLMKHEAGCAPTRETQIAMDTLRASFADLTP